ncbi:MAG: ribosomal L7Ae/L30e/S12e/Gadd45 family protein [Candidatus Aenigmarchaeota archaeon]|nr:ribosomal L7Ae/L30e/S12e/Gadd45 family protein [Candidatus Aenigmarchaeota archaeon]
METISKLPEKKAVIGTREIIKAIAAGKVKEVVVAGNCPQVLVDKLGKAQVHVFEGNERELATKLGKPFPVAMAGFE